MGFPWSLAEDLLESGHWSAAYVTLCRLCHLQKLWSLNPDVCIMSTPQSSAVILLFSPGHSRENFFPLQSCMNISETIKLLLSLLNLLNFIRKGLGLVCLHKLKKLLGASLQLSSMPAVFGLDFLAEWKICLIFLVFTFFIYSDVSVPFIKPFFSRHFQILGGGLGNVCGWHGFRIEIEKNGSLLSI